MNADIAMYKAKETGKSNFVLYTDEMNEIMQERMKLERHLRIAMDRNELMLHYQPQVDLKNFRISGFEALIRWNSPELGMVSPARFIKTAEDSQLIIPLGTWVLHSACSFIRKIHDQGYTGVIVSVNISMLQLMQQDFTGLVMNALESQQLQPSSLELEITESVLMESYESIHSTLLFLRERGVRIALDDFGKGYSSLSYLMKLPISTLKIDRLFIENISGKYDRESITGHIIRLGRRMGLCVVAEGVETNEQIEYLIKHKCDKIQGYIISKAIPENQVAKLMKDGTFGCVREGKAE